MVQKYIKRKEYGNVRHQELWAALAEVGYISLLKSKFVYQNALKRNNYFSELKIIQIKST